MVKSTLLVKEVWVERGAWSTMEIGGFSSVHAQTKAMWPDKDAIQHAGCRRASGLTNQSRHTDKTQLHGERAQHLIHALHSVTDMKQGKLCVRLCVMCVWAFWRCKHHWGEGFCAAKLPGSSTGPHPRVSRSQMVSLVTTGQLSTEWTLITIIQGRPITTHWSSA